MEVFRWSGPMRCKGCDIMEKLYFIEIDVRRTACVATIKGGTKKIFKQTIFGNDAQGMTGFIEMICESKYVPTTAVCESTGNYWRVLYDTPREAGINTLVSPVPHQDHNRYRLQGRRVRLREAGQPGKDGHGSSAVRGQQTAAGSARANPGLPPSPLLCE